MRFFRAVSVFVFAVTAWAQNDMPANVNLQFRFDNPGARARAMGGAFIGLADDTTAIFANPAGLTQLKSTTLALEAARTERNNEIPFAGGEIRRIGLQDFEFDLESRDFPETSHSIPFLGYVRTEHPLKWGVFYNEQARFKRAFETTGVAIPPYQGPTYTSNSPLFFFNPGTNVIDLKIRALGGSLAGSLGSQFSAGITVTYNEFDYRGNSTLLIPDLEALFPEVNFDPRVIALLRPLIGQPFGIIDVDGSDQALGVFLGMLYQPTDRFSLGISYKSQPGFDYDHRSQSADADFMLEAPVLGKGKFNVPDSLGVGLSFKPTDFFVLSLDVNRVRYSELAEDYTKFFDDANDPAGHSQTIDDATEYRAGIEYYLVGLKYPLALRAGYWSEPYHALINTNLDTQTLFGFVDQNGDFVQGIRPNMFLQRFARDQNHATFGLGLSLGAHFVVDVAADIAEESKSFSLSSIYRF